MTGGRQKKKVIVSHQCQEYGFTFLGAHDKEIKKGLVRRWTVTEIN